MGGLVVVLTLNNQPTSPITYNKESLWILTTIRVGVMVEVIWTILILIQALIMGTTTTTITTTTLTNTKSRV
jgi:hypothetical protein